MWIVGRSRGRSEVIAAGDQWKQIEGGTPGLGRGTERLSAANQLAVDEWWSGALHLA